MARYDMTAVHGYCNVIIILIIIIISIISDSNGAYERSGSGI